eukprot:11774627-Alexandrium_andersonii.AAC.1
MTVQGKRASRYALEFSCVLQGSLRKVLREIVPQAGRFKTKPVSSCVLFWAVSCPGSCPVLGCVLLWALRPPGSLHRAAPSTERLPSQSGRLQRAAPSTGYV